MTDAHSAASPSAEGCIESSQEALEATSEYCRLSSSFYPMNTSLHLSTLSVPRSHLCMVAPQVPPVSRVMSVRLTVCYNICVGTPWSDLSVGTIASRTL